MRIMFAFVFALTVAVASQVGGNTGRREPAGGQNNGKPQVKKTNVAGVDVKAPVTKSEAAAVFTRARKAIASARIAPVAAKSTITAGSAAVSREEVILEMGKILEASKKSIKFIPALTRYEAKSFRVGSAGSKAALAKLVAWGFVGPVGPLATGPKPGLSIAQFGDAVGFFMARLADVTHMPSPKWSPYLQPNDGG